MKMIQHNLFENPYPGRTLIVGMNPSGTHYVQIYWIMGRSANSRNRVFRLEAGSVKNDAFDPKLVEDPSLIIYYPIRQWKNYHIASNGDHTDTIYNGLQQGSSYVQSLLQRQYEPDDPHYTPRISALIDSDLGEYYLSILKTSDNDPSICIRNHFHYSQFQHGIGHCIHTYSSESEGILKPFVGEPFRAPLFDDMNETADYYWKQINNDNKISLLVKFITVTTNEVQFQFRNKLI